MTPLSTLFGIGGSSSVECYSIQLRDDVLVY